MIDAEFFKTTLQQMAEEMENELTVTVVLHGGSSYNIARLKQVNANHIVAEVFPNNVRAELREARTRGERLRKDRVAIALGSISHVLMTSRPPGQEASTLGFSQS